METCVTPFQQENAMEFYGEGDIGKIVINIEGAGIPSSFVRT